LGDDSLPRKSEQHGETAAEQTVSGKGTVGKLALGSPSRVLNMPVKPPATTAPNLPPPPAPAREPVAGPSAGEGGIVVAKGMPTPSVTARPSLKPPPDLAAKKAPVRLPESKAKATSPLPAKAPAVKPPPAKRGGLVGLLTREHNYSSMEAPPGYQLKDELKAADKIDAKDARQKEDNGRLDFEYAQKQQADQPAENLERQHSQAAPDKKLGTGLTQAKSNVSGQRPDDSARSVDLPADEAKDADNELFKTVTTHGGRARPEGVEGKSAAKDEQPAFIRVPAQQSLSYYDVSDVTHEIRDFQGDLQKPEDRPAEQQKAAVAAEQPAPKPATEGEKESGESAQQGGPNTIQYRNGKLIVSHNPEVKEQITKLLEDRKGTQTEDESTESNKAQTELQITQEAIEAPVFKAVPVNPFVLTEKDRFSTFALDVDTASYYLARRYILDGRLPPPPAVRMEEFVNAFDYNYPRSSQGVFTVQAEGMPSPFRPGLALLKIGVQGRALGRDGRRPTHFVFVVDASGSMARADRMPLVQHGLMMLTEQLGAADRFTLVTFGSGADLVLEAAPGSEKQQIRNAIAALRCGGSTNLLDGVLRGYEAALRKFRAGEINRVVLLSDGAANIGVTEADDMLAKVDTYRKHGITFTSVGFGTGSYNDEVLEKLSNKGDGTYTFVSSREEAALVLGVQMATLQVIAKDAKIQVEFSPEAVRRYRLIGYENRDVADKDFRNDAIDAGEVACGQSSTALYEMELADAAEAHGDIGTVYVRYRNAETSKVEEISTRLERPLIAPRTAAEAPRLYLAAAVAEFAEILRGSEHVAGSNVANVKNVLVGAANELPLDQRVADLLRVVERSGGLPVAQWQQ